MTHNKNRNYLLCLLIDCISARSAPQISYSKDECTFRFSNFLVTGLRNSFANCRVQSVTLPTQAMSEGRWFVLVSLFIADLFGRVTVPPEDFLSRNL